MKRNHKYLAVSLLPLLMVPAFFAAGPYLLNFAIAACSIGVSALETVADATTPMPTDDELFNSLLVNRNDLETLVTMYVYDLDIKSIQVPMIVPPHIKLSPTERKHSIGEPADTLGYYPEYDALFKHCKLKHGMIKGDDDYLLFPVYSTTQRRLDGTVNQQIEKGFAFALEPPEKEVMTLQGETPGAIKFRGVRGPWYLYLRAGSDLGDSLRDFR